MLAGCDDLKRRLGSSRLWRLRLRRQKDGVFGRLQTHSPKTFVSAKNAAVTERQDRHFRKIPRLTSSFYEFYLANRNVL